jgi:hypothetical protein
MTTITMEHSKTLICKKQRIESYAILMNEIQNHTFSAFTKISKWSNANSHRGTKNSAYNAQQKKIELFIQRVRFTIRILKFKFCDSFPHLLIIFSPMSPLSFHTSSSRHLIDSSPSSCSSTQIGQGNPFFRIKEYWYRKPPCISPMQTSRKNKEAKQAQINGNALFSKLTWLQ